MHTLFSAIVAVGLITGALPHAKQHEAPALRGTTEAEIVGYAEKEGAAHPTDARLPRPMPEEFVAPPEVGSSQRMCVQAVAGKAIRSGEFVIRGELSGPLFRRSPQQRGEGLKVAWDPLHHGPRMQLVVRGKRVGTNSETQRLVSSVVAHGVPGPGQKVPEAERIYGFPTSVDFLAQEGTWVVVATQGPDWGCFVLNISTPAIDPLH